MDISRRDQLCQPSWKPRQNEYMHAEGKQRNKIQGWKKSGHSGCQSSGSAEPLDSLQIYISFSWGLVVEGQRGQAEISSQHDTSEMW